jgi:radical SAM protein with 4Fe4S-binding SPASM domain
MKSDLPLKRIVNGNKLLFALKEHSKRINAVKKLLARHNQKAAGDTLMFAVEISSVCNLNCKFCSYPIAKREKRIIPLDEYTDILNGTKAIISESGKSGSFIALSGIGEPFLIRNITEYLVRTREILPGASIGIASNFTCIEEETIEKIVREKLIDVLSCSLNYFDEDTYRDICGGDYLNKVLEAIDCFAECRRIYGSTLKLTLGMKKHENITNKDASDFESYAMKRWNGAVTISWNSIGNWGEGIDLSGFVNAHSRLLFPCFGLYDIKYLIDHKGNVYPCCACFTRDYTEELLLGNILIDSHKIMIERFKKIRDIHLRSEWRSLPICAHCNVYTQNDYDIFFRIGRRYF